MQERSDPTPAGDAPASDGEAELPLGDRLVHAALDQLAEEGVEALTLRSVARRAGVSHAAPARHFENLADLLAEVAATGFRMLSEAIEKSGASLPPDANPRARLGAGGRAYLDCALAHPGLFALMFRSTALNRENAALQRDSRAAFERLLDLVRDAQASGWHAARDPERVAGVMWASVHGLATLWVHGAYTDAMPDASLDLALATVFELVASPADAPPPTTGTAVATAVKSTDPTPTGGARRAQGDSE